MTNTMHQVQCECGTYYALQEGSNTIICKCGRSIRYKETPEVAPHLNGIDDYINLPDETPTLAESCELLLTQLAERIDQADWHNYYYDIAVGRKNTELALELIKDKQDNLSCINVIMKKIQNNLDIEREMWHKLNKDK